MTTEKLRILVVDDEPHQLETVCRGLFLYDYDSVGVSSADEALAALNGPGGDGFDLVLTDLTMPGSSGIALVDEVRRRRPDFPIIVITGLAASEELETIHDKGLPVLKKPFEPDDLDRVIQSVFK